MRDPDETESGVPDGVILVSGASGFVGTVLCKRLAELGWSYRTLGRGESAEVRVDLGADFRIDPEQLVDVAALVHCAAATPAAEPSDGTFAQVNVEGTRRLCAALDCEQRLEVVVLLSSIGVYGDGERTAEGPPSPTSEYGQSKLSQEQLVVAWGRARGVPVAVLRPSSIYGPGARQNTVLPIFVDRATRGEPLEVTAPRNATQNFVHVQDVVSCIVAALSRRPDAAFNVFSSETHSYLALAQFIARRLDVPVHDRSAAAGPPPKPFPNDDVQHALGVRFRPLAQGLDGMLQ